MTETSELLEILDRQAELIEELGAMAKAFNYCYDAFSDKWSKLIEEGQKLIADYESGEVVSKESTTENLIKTKLMREVVCLMGEVLEEFREGGDECSE